MPLKAAALPAAALCALSVLAAAPAGAVERTIADDARRGLTLTIYQNGQALVHDKRWVPLVAGRNTLQIEGMSEQLRLGSLRVYSNVEGVELVERSEQPADLTPAALLERYVGKRVLYVSENPETGEETSQPARLLSLAGGVVLEVDGRIELNPPGRIALDAMEDPAEGLQAEPGLSLVIDSGEARPAELTLGYLTDGLEWQADYVADLAPDGGLDLTATVAVTNNLNVGFPYAALRLVAGEVARDSGPPRPAPLAMRAEAVQSGKAMDQAMAPGPVALGDRYLYDTGREISLAPGERKQVALFQLSGIAAERAYSFDGLASLGGPDESGSVHAALELSFDAPSGPDSRPLPAGQIRVYEALDEGEGQPVFAGADSIAHTPAGNEIKLSLGRAFDVTAEARRTAYERLGERSFESAQEIVVSNAKSEPLEVEVVGRFPRGTEIVEESAAHLRETAERVTWTLQIPANGSTTLTYRARVQN
jgi:hypothetical protein